MAMQYVMAYSELHDRLKQWGNTPNKTNAQRQHYPVKQFKLTQLGNGIVPTGEDSIRLLQEDGWDGDYVGSVSPITASQYGWHKEYPVNPKQRDLLRFGLFFHLGFYKTVLLIIKGVCEQALYQALVEDGTAADTPMIDLVESLHTDDPRLVDFANDLDRHINAEELYRLFEDHNAWASSSGYDYQKFRLLLADIATEKVQAYRLDSDYAETFILNRETERTGIGEKDAPVQEQYYKLKQEWIGLRNDVELLLIQQETIREKYAQVQSNWSQRFGETELNILSLKCRREELAYIVNIKESNAAMNYTDVLKLAGTSIAEKRRQYETERKQLEWLLATAKMMSQNTSLGSFAAGGISGEKLAEYDVKLKSMLHKIRARIFFRTHPDGTMHEKFTDKQLKELQELYQSIVNLKGINGLSARDKLPFLDSILKKAERIWANVGVDIDEYDLTVILEEPAKMIEILTAKIESLEEEDANLRNDIFILLCNPEYTEKEAILSSEEAARLKEQEYSLEIDELERQIQESEKAVDALFAEE